jgi:GNAT superfamily N-acetyltransferase
MASMTFIVREIARNDRSRWEPLWRAYQARPTVPGEVVEVTWRRFFDALEPVHALVAEDADTLIGFVHYLFHRSTARLDPTCYLQDMFVAPAARRGGVGRALIEGVCARAKAAGAYRVYWITDANNATARSLYDKVARLTSFVQYRIDF